MSMSCGYESADWKEKIPGVGVGVGMEVGAEVGGCVMGGADVTRTCTGDPACTGGSRDSWLVFRWMTGELLLARFSISPLPSSSLSLPTAAPAVPPSSLSVAHRLTFHPSPSPRPSFSLSRNARMSSRASWYPTCRARVSFEAAVLYRFVTERAAVLNAERSCSGGCWVVALLGARGREVFRLRMESMAAATSEGALMLGALIFQESSEGGVYRCYFG